MEGQRAGSAKALWQAVLGVAICTIEASVTKARASKGERGVEEGPDH